MFRPKLATGFGFTHVCTVLSMKNKAKMIPRVVLSSQELEKSALSHHPLQNHFIINGDDIYHDDSYVCVRSRTFDCGEYFFFCCPVSNGCLEPGKELNYLSSYPYLHLSSWMRSIQQVDPSFLKITLLGSVIVFLAFLGLEPGVRKQVRQKKS